MLVQNYLPALMYLGIATVIGLVLLALGYTLGRGSKDDAKLSPYECGFEAFEGAANEIRCALLPCCDPVHHF